MTVDKGYRLATQFTFLLPPWYWNFSCALLYLSDSTIRTSLFTELSSSVVNIDAMFFLNQDPTITSNAFRRILHQAEGIQKYKRHKVSNVHGNAYVQTAMLWTLQY